MLDSGSQSWLHSGSLGTLKNYRCLHPTPRYSDVWGVIWAVGALKVPQVIRCGAKIEDPCARGFSSFGW